MKRLVLAVLIGLAGPAAAQDARDLLRMGNQAYDFAEYDLARRMLPGGLNPAAGPRDSLWVAGLHRLAHVLIEEGKDSLAATWVRWGLRLESGLTIDTVNFPPTVEDAFLLARAHVVAGAADDGLVETTWEWDRRPPADGPGAIRIERAGAAGSVLIEGHGPQPAGERRELAPGSYTVLASAPEYFRARVTREVLPGVTTVIRLRFRTVSAAALGYLYVDAAPWRDVYLDGQRVGYTPIAAYPVPVGAHRLRLERSGLPPLDTTVVVERDARLRLGTVGIDAATPAAPAAAASGDGMGPGLAAVFATEVERAVDLLRQIERGAHAHLARASWALGAWDSAAVQLQHAVREDPFLTLDRNAFNPELVALYEATRRATPVLGLRASRDTIVAAAAERWLVSVATPQPGDVRLSLAGPGRDAPDSLVATVTAASVSTASIALMVSDSVALAPGRYRLTADYTPAGGDVGPVRAVAYLEISSHAPDPLPLEPPPADSLYRLEVRVGPPSKASLVRGVAFGAAAAAVPLLLANGRMRKSDGRAVTVGAAVSLAGLAGYFLGRPRQPLPENIAYNNALRSGWQSRARDVAAANEARRRLRWLRVRIVEAP